MPPKRSRAVAIGVGSSRNVRVKIESGASPASGIRKNSRPSTSSSISSSKSASKTALSTNPDLRREFLSFFEKSETYRKNGISNTALKKKLGEEKYLLLPQVVNELMQESKLNISRLENDLYYQLVSDDIAVKLKDLDESTKLVYQVIESASNKGIWIKDIKARINVHHNTLTKLIKTLEQRKLVKAVKSVNSKNKNLYMLYELTPAEEITGGPWYTDQTFDHGFINDLRHFILLCVKKLNHGKGVTLTQISHKMKQANVSKVPLDLDKVQQLVQTLAFDYLIEQNGIHPSTSEALFVPAKKLTTYCNFKWWDCLDDDFQYKRIVFEDGVILSAHEHHHQS